MRKAVAGSVAALAIFAFATAAMADGYRHGHGHKYGYGHRHGWSGHRHYDDGVALFAGGLLLGALVGHLAAQPRVVYQAVPAPALSNCRPITGTGYVNGRPARFSGTGCYDAYGNLYAVPGSERFLGYIR